MRLREANITVVDVETTGMDPEKDRICEVGWQWVQFDQVTDTFVVCAEPDSQTINPEVPIPPVASAVHHLTDRKVADSPTMAKWLSTVAADACAGHVFVAHNAAFDEPFLKNAGVVPRTAPFLCSMRLAKHLCPNMESYKNQVLRYEFGFETIPGDAHTAGHDAAVTAAVLCHMLNESRDSKVWTIDAVIELANKPIFLGSKEVGFGKYADKTWERVRQIDPGYLQWIRRQPESDWDPDVWFTAGHLLKSGSAVHRP